jgi:hypothetical protein
MLEEAYEAALRVAAMNARLKIEREQVPKVSEASRARGGGRPMAAHAAPVVEGKVRQPVANAAVAGSLGLRIVSKAEFAEFQAWKVELQAISNRGAGAGTSAEEDDGASEDDDQGYELGSVALLVGGARAKVPSSGN